MKVYLLLIVIVFCLPTTILSQVQFLTHTISTSADNARSVYAIDVDGDGDLDVLSASEDDSRITWYENNGNENFTAHTITSSASGAESVYAVDLDSDGDMDVLSASVFDSKTAWYENDGDENFITHIITTNAENPRSVFAIDVDSDGDIDVLSASASGFDGDDIVAWYENDGNESFSTQIISSGASWVETVFAVDLDGDGDIDVLSASASGGGEIVWHENNGSESFSAHTIINSVHGASRFYAVDLDGDGDIDVLSASGCSGDGEIAWHENDGSENFNAHTITTSVICAMSVYAVDVDGDEDLDVLSASGGDDKVAWYENDGSENFTTHIITMNADGVRSVYAVDVDGDGDMDVLSASEFDDKIAWYENLSAPISVEFDIKPQTCPNPVNVVSKGNIPVAIIGTSDFDVQNIDPATVLFDGAAPIRWAIEDVCTSVAGGEPCDCTTDGPDGFDDLILKFDAQEIVTALGSVNNGDELILTITGNLFNGTSIEGSDCVIILTKGNRDNQLVQYSGQISEQFALFENYPNPFSLNTTIQFTVPEQSFVKLEIYSSQGIKVTTLVSEELVPGTYSFNWNVGDLPSGIYLCRIEAGAPLVGSGKVYKQIKKMTLLR